MQKIWFKHDVISANWKRSASDVIWRSLGKGQLNICAFKSVFTAGSKDADYSVFYANR